MTVALTYVGPDEVYNGIDGGAEVRIEKDATEEVSEEMAERLLADFPGWFKKGAGAEKSSSGSKASPAKKAPAKKAAAK